MSRPSLRQQIVRNQRGPSADETAAADYQSQIMNLDLFSRGQPYGSSFRFHSLNQRVVFVPTLNSRRPTPVVLRPWDRGGDLQTAIDVGFETGQLSQRQIALNPSTGVVRINGGSRRTHEAITRARGTIIRNGAGHYISHSAAISASSGAGHNPRLDIPGARIDRLTLAGFKGSVGGNFEANNPNLDDAAITFRGTPTLHGARTRNLVVNRTSFGSLVSAAGDHATTELFDPTHPIVYHSIPSHSDVRRALTSHVQLGSTAQIRHSLAHNASRLAHILRDRPDAIRVPASAEAIAAFSGHVSARKRDQEREWQLQHPHPV